MRMPRPPKPPARTFLTNGAWYWKPGRRLRSEGRFSAVPLGVDVAAAWAEARALNRRADQWLGKAGRPKLAAPRGTLTFGQVVEQYCASPAFAGLRASTRETYRSCLRILLAEFESDRAGRLTRARVLAWADPLRRSAPQGLRHYAAVGRAVMNWARERDLVAFERNPFDALGIEAGRRKIRVLENDLAALVARADAMGEATLGTTMIIGFWCIQRIWDALALTEKEFAGVGLLFAQSKTGQEIDIPRLPAPVAARLATHRPPAGRLSADSAGRAFRRVVEAEIGAALAEATPEGRARARRLKPLQLRDMRRSGFCWYAEKAVPVHLICSMSGHTIEEGMQIIETYLPKTAAQADLAIEMAWRAKK